MYLYFIASKNGSLGTSNGVIENDFIIKTSEQYQSVIDKFKEKVSDDIGCRIEDIAITQFNRLN